MYDHEYPTPETYGQVLGYARSKKKRRYNRLVEVALAKHKAISGLANHYNLELELISRRYPGLESSKRMPGIEKLLSMHKVLCEILEDFVGRKRNVAFIGEFSSGKSTLINAVFGREILPMDLLEGTTTYPIELLYGPYGGEIVYEDSTTIPVDPNIDSDGDIVWAQYQLARLRPFRRGLSHFRVSLPTKKLSKLTFFDTPGINSNYPTHTERAIRAIKLLCDSFVVIIPSTQPLTDHLLSFLKENLSDKYEQCVFVLSKFDLIRREDDRTRLKENITTRLVAGLGLDFTPEVLPVSADVALSRKLKISPNQDRAVHLTEEEIRREITSFRTFTNRLFDLAFERSLLAFENNLEGVKREIVDLLSEISESPHNVIGYISSNADIGSFDECVKNIEAFRNISAVNIDRCLRDTLAKVETDVDYYSSTVEQIVGKAIEMMSKKDELATWSAGALHTIYRRFIEDVNRCLDFHAMQLRQEVGKLLEGTLKGMNETYKIPNCESLLTIPLLALDVNQTARDAEYNTNTAAANLGNGIGLGGAATGAGVGSLMLGPVGFLVGGLLGGVVGANLNILTESDRKKYKTVAMESLRSIRSKAKNQARNRMPSWKEYVMTTVDHISRDILDDQKRKIECELVSKPDCTLLSQKARSDLRSGCS